MSQRRSDRKDQILQTLAQMLEASPGSKITTAKLAANLGVSEAALYRHFPSKTRMFESLIDFVEETLFSRITQILNEESNQLTRCKKILTLFLVFCERNPGITRILSGDALTGEHARLRGRVAQVYDRIETQLRQCLRMAEVEEGWRTAIPVNTSANLLLALVEGRIAQFVRSDFGLLPTRAWDDQWSVATSGLSVPVPSNP
ncbi:nucleoid occlusion factor SlmA [Luminiphilus sp.]|jgi:TetR/AcrR family transcriptional regulator|nr:nucleoid occlusion factor SlmA [Luminiphilus sp.]MDA8656830.1 nucleoid occlusion factor SlmA [Luminiphilus sp.]MDA8662619.1 nucleoid occlusion factor SlmA [Luminiphilus sp.]MDA8738260.1 nucleoid occlusion factor SlmA [Luminiphilus sp.]MDA9837304.1 nucleoid occlusion factor SlmA [Luminiphilus sp.]